MAFANEAIKDEVKQKILAGLGAREILQLVGEQNCKVEDIYQMKNYLKKSGLVAGSKKEPSAPKKKKKTKLTEGFDIALSDEIERLHKESEKLTKVIALYDGTNGDFVDFCDTRKREVVEKIELLESIRKEK